MHEDCKVRITNAMFPDASQTRAFHGDAFGSAAPYERSRVFYVHDITVILRYFFEEKIDEKRILLMKISKIYSWE